MNQSSETQSLTAGGTPAPTAPPLSSSMPQNDQPQPTYVPSGYGTIETPYAAPNYSWYKELQRNRPQSTSLAAASMIFLSGGMSLSLSVGIGPVSEYGTHAQYCWFIAVIIGACISAILAHKMTKRSFYLAASILVITKGIIYIVFATNGIWIVLARYCDGIAIGLTIIPAILAGSEQSVRKLRGLVLGFEQRSLTLGALIVAVFATTWKSDLATNQFLGIASIVYGLAALLFTFVTAVESPIFLLRKNNETEALNALRQLQKPNTITNETHELLNENKMLLDEDLNRGSVENITNSWIPLVKITALRTLVSLSFSLPLTWGFLLASGLNDLTIDPNPLTYVFMRLLGVAISLWSVDCLGRKTTGGLALLTGSCFLLGVGTSFSSSSNNSPQTVITYLLLHQICAGIVAPASTSYLGEAFSLSVKPYFILISIVVENVAQIIVCSQATFDSTSNFAFVMAALQFVYALIYIFLVPETAQTTLREALNKFRATNYIRLES